MKRKQKEDGGRPLDPNNPSPFKQPFLVINFGWGKNGLSNGQQVADGWHVDVNGQIEKYIDGCNPRTLEFAPPANNIDKATPLMRALLAFFWSRGRKVKSITTYIGTAGPSHILRNGAFFERMNL